MTIISRDVLMDIEEQRALKAYLLYFIERVTKGEFSKDKEIEILPEIIRLTVALFASA